MKTPALTRTVLAASILLSLHPGILPAQNGTVQFVNSISTTVFDSRTGLPVATDVAVAGLYYSTNLNASPNPFVPSDEFQLAATQLVSTSTNPALRGIFLGGTVSVPGTSPGQSVVVQVRVWSRNYPTYEAALLDGQDHVAYSDRLGPMALGGGILPPPSLLFHGLSQPMVMDRLVTVPPPTAHNAAFSMAQNGTLVGRVTAENHQFMPLTFALASPPPVPGLILHPDGSFAFRPPHGLVGSFELGAINAALPATANLLASNGPIRLEWVEGNRAPQANPLEFSVATYQDSITTSGQLTGSDPDGHPLTYAIASLPRIGSLSLAGSGQFTYSTLADRNRTETFSYTVSDGFLTSDPATITLRIVASPPAPGGAVTFANNSLARVIDHHTGLPMQSGVGKAGLYYSNNLDDIPNPAIPKDAFSLVRAVNILNGGIFIGGTVSIPGNIVGTPVLLQVRIWSAAYNSYEKAFLNNDDLLGASNLMLIYTLGGTLPTPTLIQGGLQSIPSGTFNQNQLPVAHAELLSPAPLFPTSPHPVLIAPDNIHALVTLDASLSSDPNLDTLHFGWFLNNNHSSFNTNSVATIHLPLGLHTITLLVDDGRDADTDLLTLEIITLGAAVEELMPQLEASPLGRNEKKPLHAQLKSAYAFFERGSFKSGASQLKAFQNSLDAKAGKSHPDITGPLIDFAQSIRSASP